MEPTKFPQRKGREGVSPELRERMQRIRRGLKPGPLSANLKEFFTVTGRAGGLAAAESMTAEQRSARTAKGNAARRQRQSAAESTEATIDDDKDKRKEQRDQRRQDQRRRYQRPHRQKRQSLESDGA
jgi:hypothetical protein